MQTIYKLLAFTKKDFIVEASYKISFILEILAAIFPVLSFFFIAKIVRPEGGIAKYGVGYFSFVVVGLAMSQYFTLALRAFSTSIRRNQWAGCLEAIMSTRTRPELIIVFSTVYSFISKLVQVFVVIFIALILQPGMLARANLLSASVAFCLSVVSFAAIGILSASLIMVVKQGDPIEWLFSSLSSLIGGALFPVELMPAWLQKIALLLPITHALDAIRLALLKGYSICMLKQQLGILFLFAIVFFPLSIWSFHLAIAKCKRDGTLLHY